MDTLVELLMRSFMMPSTHVIAEPSSMLTAEDATGGVRVAVERVLSGGNRGSPEKPQMAGASAAAEEVR